MDAAPKSQPPSEIGFGDWRYKIQESELRRGGESVRLQPRIAKLLTQFVLHPNQVISRDQLIDFIWGQKSINEDALSRCIAELRGILGDKSNNPQFIETIPKRGYRFIAPVSQPAEQSSKKLVKQVMIALVGVFILATLFIYKYAAQPQDQLEERLQAALVTAERISADNDYKYQPQLSTKGDKVAYSVAQDGFFVIKIIDNNGAYLQTLSEPGFHLMSPRFAPDDEKLFLVRFMDDGCQIYSYNLLTKQKQLFVQCATPGASSMLDLSPDGRYLAYVAAESIVEDDLNKDNTNSTIWLLEIETGSKTQLTTNSSLQDFDTSPRFSPDGTALAFIRGSSSIRNIYLMPFNPESFSSHSVQQIPAKSLTEDAAYISHLDWLKDSRRIIFDSNKQGDRSLWLLDTDTMQQKALGARDAQFPTLDKSNQGIVFQEVNYNANIWQVNLAQDGKSVSLIESIKYNNFPRFSPNGDSVVFVSNRKGRASIWLYDVNSKSQTEIMSVNDAELINPIWDESGNNLLVSSRGVNGYQCYQLNIASKTFEQLANINQQYFGCIFGTEEDIYAISREPGQPAYMFRLDKQGKITKLSEFSVNQIAATADGSVIFSRPDVKGIFRLNLASKDVEILVADYHNSWSAHWSLVGNNLYFARFKQDKFNGFGKGIYRMGLSTLAQQKITSELPSAIGNTLDVHPNQKSILVTKTDRVIMSLYYASLSGIR